MRPRVLQHDVKGEGEPVVLVPGGLTGWVSWVPHQERLAARHRVIRLQPIHNELGSRGEIPDPTYDDDVERESLRLTLDALDVGAADLAGWSAGANAALEFSLTYSERVRTLTLVEPSASWAAADALQELLRRTRRVVELEPGLGGLSADGVDPRTLPQWPVWVTHRQTLAAAHLLGRNTHTLAEVAAFDRPVLLVKGSRSVSWERAIVDVLGAHYQRATVLELEGGHAAHIESIDAFLDALEQHLAGARTADV